MAITICFAGIGDGCRPGPVLGATAGRSRALTALLGLLLLLLPLSAPARPLTIASWNLDNYAAEGQFLRGKPRSVADHDEMRALLAALDADVIALQEVASAPAAQTLLGPDYALFIEPRCHENTSACQVPADAIYTAIAWRRSLEQRLSISPFDLAELALIHRDECGQAHQVRGGSGLRLQAPGKPPLRILSVHLKAACKDDRIEPGTEDDCATQDQQFALLADWARAQQQTGEELLILGDFNRRLDQPRDRQRARMTSPAVGLQVIDLGERSCWRDAGVNFAALRRRALEKHPAFLAEERRPWIYDPANTRTVDHALASPLAAGWLVSAAQLPMTGRYRLGDVSDYLIKNCDGSLRTDLAFADSYPSDHCPLRLLLDFGAAGPLSQTSRP